MSTFQLQCDPPVTWLNNLGDGAVDLVITQLPKDPQAITTRLNNARSVGNQWFALFPKDPYPGLFRQLFRVLKHNRHCYLFGDAEALIGFKPLAEAAGFRFRQLLAWDGQKARAQRGNLGYRQQLGWIALLEKGHLPLADPKQGDLLSFPSRDKAPPADLLEHLLAQSSQPGQLVIDPLLNNERLGEVVLKQDRRFAGACADETLWQACRAHLAAVPQATELFYRPKAEGWAVQEPQLALL